LTSLNFTGFHSLPLATMGPLDLLNHLLNFVAPAAWVAVVVTMVARIFMKKRPVAQSLQAQIAVNFAVCLVALVLGLVVFGRDGKMATYAAMALLGASSQWVMLRGWR
jgi:hypothetical protein